MLEKCLPLQCLVSLDSVYFADEASMLIYSYHQHLAFNLELNEGQI